ncbi:MAG TPA: hypothetical protein VKR22_06395 [Acidimicrobiales bacterium]|nr:hypothetical protein [Acidimicrobiales bacterium]
MANTVAGARSLVARVSAKAEVGARRAQAALLAQRIRRSSPARSGDGVRLHLGCGSVHLNGWCNIDNEPGSVADVRWDLRQGLPLPSGIASRIYSEHFFEHLELDEGKRLFSDCRRVLRDQGVFRLAMPDLGRIVENYKGPWRDVPVLQDPSFAFIDTNAHYINHVFRAWGHLYLYDYDDLELRLRQAGFGSVTKQEKGISGHADLCGLETRAESWLVVEATP